MCFPPLCFLRCFWVVGKAECLRQHRLALSCFILTPWQCRAPVWHLVPRAEVGAVTAALFLSSGTGLCWSHSSLQMPSGAETDLSTIVTTCRRDAFVEGCVTLLCWAVWLRYEDWDHNFVGVCRPSHWMSLRASVRMERVLSLLGG